VGIFKNLCLVIPAYEPSDALVPLLRELAPHFKAALTVDDGSRESVRAFAEAASVPGVTVLRHAANRGKGAALKTAFAEIVSRHPGCGAVTADADGQHLAKDVIAVAEALCAENGPEGGGRMVIGARRFTGRGVPFRSRLGNLWTVGEFRLLTGRRVSDTQSGLRGIPAGTLPALMGIPGERYEYEIAVLVAMAKAGRIVEVPVSTVYAAGNATSHYRPLADTWRTQKSLFSACLKGTVPTFFGDCPQRREGTVPTDA